MSPLKQANTINPDRPWFSFMCYSDPGVGKTFLAGTSAREDHDTLILHPPQDHVETIGIHFPDVEVDEVVLTDWDVADEVHEELRHTDHGYRWVWLDSVSLWQDTGLDHLMDMLVAEKPHRNLYVPDVGDYGENMNRLNRYVRLMSALDFNFGMTAHVMRYTSPTTGLDMLMPWVQGKMMPEKICGMANVVGYLETRETEKHGKVRVLHTETHDEYYAKDGFGAFSKGRIINPTIPKMEEMVERAKKKEAQRQQEEEDYTF